MKDKTNQLQVQEPIQEEATKLIAMAIEKNVDVATMEKLLAMRRELKAERAKEAYDKAMADFQRDCPTIRKTKQGYNYKYAALETIIEQVKGLLAEHGFSYTFDTDEIENAVIVSCKVKHIAGHMEISKATINRETTSKMNVSQQSGAAMTYGKRYAFVNAFGILTGDEDVDAVTTPPSNVKSHSYTGDNGLVHEPVEDSQNASHDIDALKRECTACGVAINENVYLWSVNHYHKALCYTHQQEEKGKQV